MFLLLLEIVSAELQIYLNKMVKYIHVNCGHLSLKFIKKVERLFINLHLECFINIDLFNILLTQY